MEEIRQPSKALKFIRRPWKLSPPLRRSISTRFVFSLQYFLPTVILSLQSGGNRNTNNVKIEIIAQGIIRYIA